MSTEKRRAFYIEVGDMSAEEAANFLELVKEQYQEAKVWSVNVFGEKKRLA